MSEYEYYEFQAIDRPLTAEQMTRLRSLSTRATITPPRFTNFYTWGSFKGDPALLMEQYFDMFVYVTNWAAHELMLRLPRRLLGPAAARRYRAGESLRVRSTAKHVILTFRSDRSGGYYVVRWRGYGCNPTARQAAGGTVRSWNGAPRPARGPACSRGEPSNADLGPVLD